MILLVLYILGVLVTAFILGCFEERDAAGWAIIWPALCLLGAVVGIVYGAATLGSIFRRRRDRIRS